MSHRINLYAYNQATPQLISRIGEWKYEIPLLLFPLLQNPIVDGHLIYLDIAAGIPKLQKFYDFIENMLQLHQHENFKINRHRILSYLSSLEGKVFYLDAADVFDLNKNSYVRQAADLAEEIIEIQSLFDQSMQIQSLVLLNDLLTEQSFNTWLDMLEHGYVQYGWKLFEIGQVNHSEAHIFKDNNKYGLKDYQNKIIVEAIYDYIYWFSEHGHSILINNEKYGIINTIGEIIIPTEWDYIEQLDDKNYHRFIAVKNSAVGLIDLQSNTEILPTIYSKVECFPNGYVQVLKDQKYTVLDRSLNVIFENSELPFQYYQYDFLYVLKEKSPRAEFYSGQGHALGLLYPNYLRVLSHDLILIKPIKKIEKYFRLLNNLGQYLYTDIQKVSHLEDQQQFAFQRENKWYLFDIRNQKVLRELADIKP